MMRRLAAALLFFAALPSARAADAVESFYAGKNITLIIGYSAGGGYDTYARVLARHMGEHIPGKPTIVPQNMTGAGSLRATNYLYGVAAKDGTVMATFARGMAMEPLLNPTGTQFDAQKLTWIGSVSNEVSICGFMAEAGIKTWQDMREKTYTLGGSGPGADTDIFPVMLRNMFGLKFKLATGYPGGADITLAMQRHEISGRCGWSWSSILSRNRDMLDAKAFTIPLQFALEKHEDLPDVPLVLELTKDPKQLAALKLIVSRQAMARPFAAPPGIPADRRDALRAAFDATMKDKDFLAEAKKNDLEVRPVSGAALETLIGELYHSPPEVVALARQIIKE
jgi:tripartite-type tricarboxylate transporter receptor subunit TctC